MGTRYLFQKPPVFFLGSLAICGISLLGFSNECVRVLEPFESPRKSHVYLLDEHAKERRDAYRKTYQDSKTEEAYGDTTSLEILCAGHILTHENHRGELTILGLILAAGSIAAYQSKYAKFTVILKK